MHGAVFSYDFMAKQHQQDAGDRQHVFTCTVGRKPSRASLYFNSVADVGDSLAMLGSCATAVANAATPVAGSTSLPPHQISIPAVPNPLAI